MRGRVGRAAAVLMAAVLAGAGCTGDGGEGKDGPTVGVLLPSRAVPRWEQSDKPMIEKRVSCAPSAR